MKFKQKYKEEKQRRKELEEENNQLKIEINQIRQMIPRGKSFHEKALNDEIRQDQSFSTENKLSLHIRTRSLDG